MWPLTFFKKRREARQRKAAMKHSACGKLYAVRLNKGSLAKVSSILKAFLAEYFSIHGEFTFDELPGILASKKIRDAQKKKIIASSAMLNAMEFGTEKITGKKLNELIGKISSAIKEL